MTISLLHIGPHRVPNFALSNCEHCSWSARGNTGKIILKSLRQIWFYFLEPPRIVGKKKFHANVGETANLLCDIKGHPSPKVTWSWQSATGNALSISEGKGVNGYSVTTSRRNATTRGTLVIEKVTTDNWGIYSCQAVNALGTDTSDMTLSGKSKFYKVLIQYNCVGFVKEKRRDLLYFLDDGRAIFLGKCNCF